MLKSENAVVVSINGKITDIGAIFNHACAPPLDTGVANWAVCLSHPTCL